MRGEENGMEAIKRIGVITSGGDCGGLNAVIKGVAQEGWKAGIETVVIPNGYAGLYNLIEMDRLTVLDRERAGRIDAGEAGSCAGNSRVKIKTIDDPEKYKRIHEGLEKFGIDALVISGGDDTGSVVVDLTAQGIPCVHVPKTMDLDLQSYSVGGDSTIELIAEFTRSIKTTGLSHDRIVIMEVFGRYVGHTAFRGGVGAEADCILIPEVPVDFDVVYAHMKERFFHRVEASDVRRGTYVIVVAEGLRNANGEMLYDETAGVDSFGHKRLAGSGRFVHQQLEKRLQADPEVVAFMKRVGLYVPGAYLIPEVREVTPGHLVRSGSSSAFDVNFGMKAGAAAVLMLLAGRAGNTVTSVDGRMISYLPTARAIERREVDLEEVALFEGLGTCFGRKPKAYEPAFVEASLPIRRNY
jgi:6-phosphofructokinase 1